jgi:hypothetical protein
MSQPSMDIDKRVAISLSLQRYLRAVDRFEKASNEFNQACCDFRAQLANPSRFIAQFSYQNYLVTCDSEGNFEVEELELI